MARRTKARKSPARSAPKKKATTRGSKAGKAAATPAKGKGQRGTEVERRWASYLKQRTALEDAVAAVQAATQQLRDAREVEAARRKEFDESKSTLEQLLEVDAAQGLAPRRERLPSEPPRPSDKPPREKGEARQPLLGQ